MAFSYSTKGEVSITVDRYFGDPLTFVNNEEGFMKLLNWMQDLQKLKHLNAEIVGIQSIQIKLLNRKKDILFESL
ncbi:hypothetical protein KHA96_18415 [Bacillus sp. FJAT-49711]|uniref:hypothetical protein n=1 Tax=Bacillus sp. FJAT-49711 TaxID=2833585 RepID=UPI001BC9BDB3|nr:hypothetical protein [Bacillus sp. FJAT-49711]MBS4220279.1 hypothetical protein [Bacillus sp. FJAT-49711]